MNSRNSLLLIPILFIFVLLARGQEVESPKNVLQNAPADTNHVKQLLQFSEFYYFSKPDSCLILAKEAIKLAQELHYLQGEVTGLNYAGEALRFLGEYPKALEMQFKALQINNDRRDLEGEAITIGFIGATYAGLEEYRQALNYLYRAYKINDSLANQVMTIFNLSNIGNAYEKMNMLDSALIIQQQARAKSKELAFGNLKVLTLTRLGIALARLNRLTEALSCYHDALQQANLSGDKVSPSRIQYQLGELFLDQKQYDSSLYYARLAYINGQQLSQKLQVLEASNLLIRLFRKTGMSDSIIYYQDIAITMNDSLFGRDKLRQFQRLSLKEQKRQQQIIQEQVSYKNQQRMIALGVVLGFFLIIAIILLRNNRHKQKVNVLLLNQKTEIQETLTKLKSTQNQLVQSEKMASLGEMTAGIAHEIQNPLNFVNNFSEVNAELIEEMNNEMERGNYGEVKLIGKEILENEQKITQHGKRADAIVKAMLQHSRISSGIKEPTDINGLVNEYLLLSYNGFRAKDKSFSAVLKTDFANLTGKPDCNAQDIGRVLQNLYNNAFYAVSERKRLKEEGYEPTVSVTTQVSGNKIIIKVKDNGNGISQKILDKIFQPFFTTKPAGQGTGLGLSLSYDIMKAHGGEIRVETEEGHGAGFIILLPIKESALK